ncbi:hypothetical protein RJT34_13029 [Clitoria ternatea]|uniref:Uncharacterized protein n=1 Tax=Clitoria ternatea TaxID=43366 RepID=A0AAN9PLC1_CLITE
MHHCAAASLNRFTFALFIKFCAKTNVITEGEQVHYVVAKHGFRSNTLIDMNGLRVGVWLENLFVSSASQLKEFGTASLMSLFEPEAPMVISGMNHNANKGLEKVVEFYGEFSSTFFCFD